MSKFNPLFPPHFKFTLLSNFTHFIVITSPLATFSCFHPTSTPTYNISINRSIHLHFIYFQLTPNSFHPFSQRHCAHLTPHNFHFHSTPLSFQTSAAVQLQPIFHSHILIAHTTYYPLYSHLTLTPTACNNTIVIVANTLYRPASLPLLAIAPLQSNFHTPLLLCLATFPTYYSHFLCIAHTLLSALFPLFTYCPYLLIFINSTFYVWPIPYYFD